VGRKKAIGGNCKEKERNLEKALHGQEPKIMGELSRGEKITAIEGEEPLQGVGKY